MTECCDHILKQAKHVHFIGIGGSGMYPLAEILHSKGYFLTGSDINESDNLKRVRELGIQVFMGHAAANLGDADLVVYTAAVKEDNPELADAIKRDIPTLERSKLLGIVSRHYGCTIAVAGTHGKTTTTSMISQILLGAGVDPTLVIGGYLPVLHSNGRAGNSDIMVCEACEYVDTFLELSPAISIILNIDADHLDYFGTLENIIKSFHKFASITSQTIIVNGDDANSMKAVQYINCKIITFGMKETNDYYPANISTVDGAYYGFDVMHKGQLITHVQLSVPGKQNVADALAACAAAHLIGVSGEDISRNLAEFHGANRRFQVYGTFHDVMLVDDFAHHPTEIDATLGAARKMHCNQVWAVFQPYTYSRTVRWVDEFARSLSAADHVVISKIMGAREKNKWGVTSQDIGMKIPGSHCIDEFEDIADFVAQNAKPGDLIITMGGGDIYKCARMIRDRLEKKDVASV
nr:UDP-N-acetylmuramate--L-alanine ligase [uncultured Solibaculum sp.]